MTDQHSPERADQQRAKPAAQRAAEHGGAQAGLCSPVVQPACSSSLFGDARLNGRGNAPVRISIMQRMQQTYGNRAVQRFLQRSPSLPVQRQAAVQTQVVVQRDGGGGGGEDCKKLMADNDFVVKGLKGKDGKDASNYYKDVSRVILETAESRGIDFERALFIVAQARGEQGLTDPAAARYRVLNIQVPKEERKGEKLIDPKAKPPVWQNDQGRKYVKLPSPEQGKPCEGKPMKEGKDGSKFCVLESPFYVFDSMEESVNHYLAELGKKRFQDAEDILKKRGKGASGGLLDFGRAIQKGGYGTDAKYIPKLCDNYNAVVKDMRTIVGNAIATKEKCLEDAQKKLKEAEENLKKAEDKEKEAQKNYDETGPVKPVIGLSLARMEVSRRKQEVEEGKKEVKDLEEKLKTLKKRLENLKEIACPSAAAKKAAAPSG